LLREALLSRLAEMGSTPDYPRLVADVLRIPNAPPRLAERLVAQAFVLEDRRDHWRKVGRRCHEAPSSPGVYVFRDQDRRALYVGKALNLRRRLRTHFAEHRWRVIRPILARVTHVEWQQTGSEVEALIYETMWISSPRVSVCGRSSMVPEIIFQGRTDPP
jgi:hypothetical protein